MGNPNPKNQITPESRANMPARGKGKKKMLLDAIKASCGNGENYWKTVIEKSLTDKILMAYVCGELIKNSETSGLEECLRKVADEHNKLKQES